MLHKCSEPNRLELKQGNVVSLFSLSIMEGVMYNLCQYFICIFAHILSAKSDATLQSPSMPGVSKLRPGGDIQAVPQNSYWLNPNCRTMKRCFVLFFFFLIYITTRTSKAKTLICGRKKHPQFGRLKARIWNTTCMFTFFNKFF